MSLKKFKGVKTVITPPEIKNPEYIERLAALQPRQQKRSILPIIGTIAVAIITVLGVSIWAIIGNGIRGQKPKDDPIVITPADKTEDMPDKNDRHDISSSDDEPDDKTEEYTHAQTAVYKGYPDTLEGHESCNYVYYSKTSGGMHCAYHDAKDTLGDGVEPIFPNIENNGIETSFYYYEQNGETFIQLRRGPNMTALPYNLMSEWCAISNDGSMFAYGEYAGEIYGLPYCDVVVVNTEDMSKIRINGEDGFNHGNIYFSDDDKYVYYATRYDENGDGENDMGYTAVYSLETKETVVVPADADDVQIVGDMAFCPTRIDWLYTVTDLITGETGDFVTDSDYSSDFLNFLCVSSDESTYIISRANQGSATSYFVIRDGLQDDMFDMEAVLVYLLDRENDFFYWYDPNRNDKIQMIDLTTMEHKYIDIDTPSAENIVNRNTRLVLNEDRSTITLYNFG